MPLDGSPKIQGETKGWTQIQDAPRRNYAPA